MQELTHLHSLYARLENEKERFSTAKTAQEKELRSVWISQLEKEIDCELEFLESKGVISPMGDAEMTDDEILAELFD